MEKPPAKPSPVKFLPPLPQSMRNLPPRTRLYVGLAFLAWGTLGIYMSDRAEKQLGFEAGPTDQEKLRELLPQIKVVERKE
ncbi:hypothetical protein K3495_g6051 [Podosphaera aphanis]|nr:hypothetical protein K3495_g6051 [Podosphaera aphanis]